MSDGMTPLQPLGHGPECRICSAVDAWVAQRKQPRRPATRGADDHDSAGVWGAESGDVRRSLGSPVAAVPLVGRD